MKKSKTASVIIPIYAGMTKCRQLFDINDKELKAWASSGKIRWTVTGPAKNAKRRFFVADVQKQLEAAGVYGGEEIQ